MFGTILQSARKNEGLSQSELARRSKTYQANISDFENEITSPSLDTANEILGALGYRLIAVPFTLPTVAEWTSKINEALEGGNEKRAFRIFLQINDQLVNCRPELVSTVCLTAPSVKDKNYLALLSGLVQYHFKRNHLPLPTWVNIKDQRLSSPWFVDKSSRLEDFIRSKTPREFSQLNVFLSEEELQSA